MSRGPGKIQKSILDTLQEQDGPILRNKLQWKLAFQNDNVVKTREHCKEILEGYIEDPYIKSFQRALKGLRENGKISVQERKLRDIDDFIDHFPFKTVYLDILMLRKELLPLVKSFINSPYRGSQYTKGDNELYVLEQIKKESPSKFRRYATAWKKIENRILDLLVRQNPHEKKRWTSLLIKGRQLFLDTRAQYRMAFHFIIEKIEKYQEPMSETEMKLLVDIKQYTRKVFRPEVMQYSKLKSQLHLVAYFSERTKIGLKEDIKMYFLAERPEIVENLPEHHQAKNHEMFGKFPLSFSPSFSPILDKLIDRYAFSKFEFLELGKISGTSINKSCLKDSYLFMDAFNPHS